MNHSISITSEFSDEYRIIMSSINLKILPDKIKDIFDANEIELIDITLERIKGESPTSVKVLSEISKSVAEILINNENFLIYFYCDDTHDVLRRDKCLSPQKYRSNLFSRMFDKYMLSNKNVDIVNTSIEIINDDKIILIHLISHYSHLVYVNLVKSCIEEMESK